MPTTNAEQQLPLLRRRYQELLQEISQIGYIASGSLAPRFNRCGKTNCRCHSDPPHPGLITS